ncbi:hypothetical protein [Mesorhizobium amorphae]|uniref:hypothetical protein n=1 Tax=Mesorhizobium amorphae TaxID=71433 RepID=UPI001186E48A|nr:hypothetical protein [Mesorhizobium amorphae]
MIKLDLWDVINAKAAPSRPIRETLVSEQNLVGDDAAKWAVDAAEKIVAEFAKAAAIETADYQLGGFIIAAAQVAQHEPEFARMIGD